MTTNLKLMNYGAVCLLDRKQQNRKPLLKMRTQIKKTAKCLDTQWTVLAVRLSSIDVERERKTCRRKTREEC